MFVILVADVQQMEVVKTEVQIWFHVTIKHCIVISVNNKFKIVSFSLMLIVYSTNFDIINVIYIRVYELKIMLYCMNLPGFLH